MKRWLAAGPGETLAFASREAARERAAWERLHPGYVDVRDLVGPWRVVDLEDVDPDDEEEEPAVRRAARRYHRGAR